MMPSVQDFVIASYSIALGIVRSTILVSSLAAFQRARQVPIFLQIEMSVEDAGGYR